MHVRQSNLLVCPTCHVHVKSICMCVCSHTLRVPFITLSMSVCVCCFHSCFNAPKRPFDIPVELLCVGLVCFMWCQRLFFVCLFVSCRRSHHWPFIKLRGLGDCEITSRFQLKGKIGMAYDGPSLCDFHDTCSTLKHFTTFLLFEC